MSVFYCHPCGNMVDNDYNPGDECPRTGDFICEDCLMEVIAEMDLEELENGQ
jgi:hypothetical protein